MAKQKSIQRFANSSLNKDNKARDKAKRGVAADSFVNFSQNLGIGADNPLTSSTYGFNPITRNRTLLEWIHRGSWLGGVAIDVVADDMTRAGVEMKGKLDPDDMQHIEEVATMYGIWNQINDAIKWSRLYGGCIAVMLIDGQDPETPLRLNTIRKGQFRGLLVLDRWMVEPSLSDLVTEMGPSMGEPKFYSVTANAPALNRQRIHHSRCLRLEGTRLPYWQRVMENLWGLSVFERLYDRMVAFDSATTGAAQLVFKSYIRTYKIEGMREVSAAGGDAVNALTRYVDMMRRFQGIEGITLLDANDSMEATTHGGFSGLSDALQQFGQQLSGALQIPLVRLFGQSPLGFNSGDSDLRNYYDNIRQQQIKQLLVPMTRIYRAIAASEDIELPEGFGIEFRSLWQMSDLDKATVASTVAQAISGAESQGLISQAAAMKELRQSSDKTGIFTNITDEDIEAAEEALPPTGEGLLGGEGNPDEPEGFAGFSAPNPIKHVKQIKPHESNLPTSEPSIEKISSDEATAKPEELEAQSNAKNI
jgi:phage-related protein (TIGR01555 family)